MSCPRWSGWSRRADTSTCRLATARMWTSQYFVPDRCDFLFGHVGDGRRWFIPTAALDATSGITLGGPKYSEFEVDPGRSLLPPSSTGEQEKNGSASTMPGSLRGSSGDGESGRTVNPVALPQWVRIPPPPSESVLASHAPHRTRAAGNRQVTIPKGCLEQAGLTIGDRFAVEACGEGRVMLTRVDDAAPLRDMLNPN